MLTQAGWDVDAGIGPESLELKWRVLYHIIDLFDELRSPGADCVLEGHLLGRLTDELGIPPAGRQYMSVDEYVASVDPAVRQQLRDILEQLKWDHLIQLHDNPYAGLQIQPLLAGHHLVTAWRQHWIQQRPFSFIVDPILYQRCSDALLRGRPGQFDAVIRDACVVLEDRVRTASGAGRNLVGTRLMRYALGPVQNGGAPRVQLSPDSNEQVGALNLCLGIVQLFRNPTAHQLIADYTREDAVRIVGLIDWILGLLRT